MRCIREEIERLDAALVSLAREETAMRLRLGQVLEALSRGGVFELGFSSPGAYALERCDRSVRWAEAAQCLARRVEHLPGLRRAMAMGKVSWSMGELLARVAQAGDEARWLEVAEGRTVRQMRLLVGETRSPRKVSPKVGNNSPVANSVDAAATLAESQSGSTVEAGATASLSNAPLSNAPLSNVPLITGWAERGTGREELCTLTCTVTREEAWLFEATRSLLQQLGAHGPNAQVEALLAEGVGTLLALLPEGAFDPGRLQGGDVAQQRWASELERWRAEAEVRCEEQLLARLLASRAGEPGVGAALGSVGAVHDGVHAGVYGGVYGGVRHGVVEAAAIGMAPLEHARCEALDGQVRALSDALARRELEFSSLLLRFHRGDGWRRLGYATETQYARERLGISQSSFMARRLLALRLEKLPAVAAALGGGQIGVEAALQLVRVATASTQAEWVTRARRRTIKHLREEVAAALVAVRSSGELSCPPPLDAEMAAFQALEQAVVSGRALQIAPAHVGQETGEAGACPVEASRFAECASELSPELSSARASELSRELSSACVSEAPPELSPVSVSEVSPEHARERVSEPVSERALGRRVWRTMLGSLAAWVESAFQTSAEGTATVSAGARSSAGRVTLLLRMSRENYAWWRGLEAQARSWLPRGVSWLRFLCLSLWQAWQPQQQEGLAYAHIYIRDRYRCTSPVCNRRDVTPHHLRFRSAGGSDESENLTSPCSWCHLRGVHGGRIRATGTARRVHWELGPKGAPCVVVDGRERMAA